jgi:hypothetical protein
MSSKNTVLQNIIHYCLCEHIFASIMLISIEGNGAVRSWDPSALHGLAARLGNKKFVIEQLTLS